MLYFNQIRCNCDGFEKGTVVIHGCRCCSTLLAFFTGIFKFLSHYLYQLHPAFCSHCVLLGRVGEAPSNPAPTWCRCHGARSGLTELWSSQASRSCRPHGLAGEGKAASSWESVFSRSMWPLFCHKKCQPGMMLPKVRNARGTSNFRAERGSRGSPNITLYLAHGTEYRKSKWEDDWREGFSYIYRTFFGVWNTKTMITTSSWRLKMGFRNGIIYQTGVKHRSKYAV